MQNLVERISKRTGMDKETAAEALLAVSEYVKNEFPLLHSVVDLILGTHGFPAVGDNPDTTGFLQDPATYN